MEDWETIGLDGAAFERVRILRVGQIALAEFIGDQARFITAESNRLRLSTLKPASSFIGLS